MSSTSFMSSQPSTNFALLMSPNHRANALFYRNPQNNLHSAVNDSLFHLRNIQRGKARLYYLEKKINDGYESQKITEAILNAAWEKKRKIEKIIGRYFEDNFTLEIFGSVVSGFGTNEYEPYMDLSLKVALGKTFNKSIHEVMYMVVQVLWEADKSCYASYHCSKRLIVLEDWEGWNITISYGNLKGLEDTALFQAYILWAPAILPQLFYFVKEWVDIIGLFGKSGLNSQILIVMVIFYLQRVEGNKRSSKNNRLLPFIQHEFYKESTNKPWKYFKREPLPDWPTQNGLLIIHFYDFLRFYEEFPYSSEVIQIIKPQRYARLASELNDPVCIRDTFYLGRNAFKKLTYHEKIQYKRDYAVANIAKHISPRKLQKMVKEMGKAASDIEQYTRTGRFVTSAMKVLFDHSSM